jgi:hypothetical protein
MKLRFDENGFARSISKREGYDAPDSATEGNFLRYRLKGGKVVDGFPGKTDEEAVALANKAIEEADFAREKHAIIPRVKEEAYRRIESTDWKVERAKERDALHGTETLMDVLQEREEIRLASDRFEEKVLGAKDKTELESVLSEGW